MEYVQFSCSSGYFNFKNIICFSAKYTGLRGKSKDWLARNQNVSEWSDMSTRGLLFQWSSKCYKDQFNRVGLVQSKHHHHHFTEM
jgi:hypothetical protein